MLHFFPWFFALAFAFSFFRSIYNGLRLRSFRGNFIIRAALNFDQMIFTPINVIKHATTLKHHGNFRLIVCAVTFPSFGCPFDTIYASFQLGFGAFNRACVISVKECIYTVFLSWKNDLISLTFSHLGDTRVVLSEKVVHLQVSKKRELPVRHLLSKTRRAI